MLKNIALGLYGWALIVSALALYLVPGAGAFFFGTNPPGVLELVLYFWFAVGLPGIFLPIDDKNFKQALEELAPPVALGGVLAWVCLAVNEPALTNPHVFGGSLLTLLFFTTWLFASAILMARRMPRITLTTNFKLSFG